MDEGGELGGGVLRGVDEGGAVCESEFVSQSVLLEPEI